MHLPVSDVNSQYQHKYSLEMCAASNMSRTDKENNNSSTDKRAKNKSRRVQDHEINEREIAAKAAEKRARKKERHRKRKEEEENALRIVQPGDSDEVRKLKGIFLHILLQYLIFSLEALDRTVGERDAAMREQGSPAELNHAGSVARPSNIHRTGVATIREHMDLAGRENKLKWNTVRVLSLILCETDSLTDILCKRTIRNAMSAAMLEYGLCWKNQAVRKPAKLYAAVCSTIGVPLFGY